MLFNGDWVRIVLWCLKITLNNTNYDQAKKPLKQFTYLPFCNKMTSWNPKNTLIRLVYGAYAILLACRFVARSFYFNLKFRKKEINFIIFSMETNCIIIIKNLDRLKNEKCSICLETYIINELLKMLRCHLIILIRMNDKIEYFY